MEHIQETNTDHSVIRKKNMQYIIQETKTDHSVIQKTIWNTLYRKQKHRP